MTRLKRKHCCRDIITAWVAEWELMANFRITATSLEIREVVAIIKGRRLCSCVLYNPPNLREYTHWLSIQKLLSAKSPKSILSQNTPSLSNAKPPPVLLRRIWDVDIHRDSGSHRDTIRGTKDEKYSVRFRLIWLCPKPLIVSHKHSKKRKRNTHIPITSFKTQFGPVRTGSLYEKEWKIPKFPIWNNSIPSTLLKAFTFEEQPPTGHRTQKSLRRGQESSEWLR